MFQLQLATLLVLSDLRANLLGAKQNEVRSFLNAGDHQDVLFLLFRQAFSGVSLGGSPHPGSTLLVLHLQYGESLLPFCLSYCRWAAFKLLRTESGRTIRF